MNGIELIAAERRRQIEQEGWTAEHDDKHHPSDLPLAAAAYADHVGSRQWLIEHAHLAPNYSSDEAPNCWPWHEEWWKPTTPLRDLVKAGALIAAAIDRLVRAEGSFTEPAQADREDAELARYMLKHAEWFRHDERTHLAVLVPAGSDLSCYKMRREAIDAAMKEKEGG